MKTLNTRIAYLYRDASNYKAGGEIVVTGHLTFSDIAPYLDGGEFFIPQQVGLEPLQSKLTAYSDGQTNDDDHVWHELREGDIAPTDAEPDATFSTRELIAAFTRAKATGWDVTRSARELGIKSGGLT